MGHGARDGSTTDVAYLVTTVDVRPHPAAGGHGSIAARHEAVLADGRRVLLLDDRGWSWTIHRTGHEGTLDAWVATSLEEIERTARVVVGPDEPRAGQSRADAARAHWSSLAALLHARGVDATADQLGRLRHDVVVADALRRRIAPGLSST